MRIIQSSALGDVGGWCCPLTEKWKGFTRAGKKNISGKFGETGE